MPHVRFDSLIAGLGCFVLASCMFYSLQFALLRPVLPEDVPGSACKLVGVHSVAVRDPNLMQLAAVVSVSAVNGTDAQGVFALCALCTSFDGDSGASAALAVP
jgi:hypothetical protein